MLRQGSAAVRGRRDDLHVRMHVLPGLCGDDARRGLPQLWRKLCAAAGTARGKTHEESPFNPAHFQSGGLRSDAPIDQDGVRVEKGRGHHPGIGCANGFLPLLCEGWKPEGRETRAAWFTTARSAQPTRAHCTRSTEVDRARLKPFRKECVSGLADRTHLPVHGALHLFGRNRHLMRPSG
jgi:hypothetical protein